MANIKELLANMIGKINGKLNAPEQAAQPNQQLVTDADGVAKWEDRTHYCESVNTVIVGAQEITTSKAPYGSSVSGSGNTTGVISEFEYGKSYLVVFDGIEYACEPKDYSGMYYLGNLKWADSQQSSEDSGEPFALRLSGETVYLYTEAASAHTVKVDHVEETVKTIDPKYIPDIGNSISVVFMALNAEPDDHGWSCTEVTCNKSVGDIYAALYSGTNIDALLTVQSSFEYITETAYNLRLCGMNDKGLIFASLGCDTSNSDAGDMYIVPQPVKVIYVVVGDGIAARCMHFSTNSGLE